MTEPVPTLVTLHVWRVPRSRVPAAVLRMGTDRSRARRTPDVSFAKMLGTGAGRTFTPRDADPTRWAMLTAWSGDRTDSPVARSWDRLAAETYRLDLRPLASRGRWSGREPFGTPAPARYEGPVAAITRARLSIRTAATFWRAVPPVSAVLQRSPGLLAALGIGEAPIGLQGTFSLWRSGDALRDFAHREAAHTDVVARTQTEGWYAEELFARFAVVDSAGTLDGRDPLNMTTLVVWDREQLGLQRDAVLDVYAEAMSVPPPVARSRRPIVTAHLDRKGLRTLAAVDEQDRLVGIAYGYLGSTGQWWHDQVRAAISPADATRWLDGAFEVCELHVRPAVQGQGLGRRLLDALLDGPPARTAILTTPDEETRARTFYRAAGWQDLARRVVFPGDPRAFAVLAKALDA